MSLIAKLSGLMRENPGAMNVAMSAFFEGVRLDRNVAIGQYSTYGAIFFDRRISPGYLWIIPSGDGGVLRGHCNVGLTMDYTEGSQRDNMDAEALFEDWLNRSTRGSSMLSGARRITPWAKGKQTFITQNMKTTDNGLILIGDAASAMLPLWSDGLAAAADSGRAAADTAWEALKNDDYADVYLDRIYRSHQLQMSNEEKLDTLKKIEIIKETMKDPTAVERAIERIRGNRDLAKGLLQI